MSVTEKPDSSVPGPLVAGPNPQRARSRRRMTPLRSAAYAVIAPLAVALLRLMWATYRFELVEDETAAATIESGEPMILAMWHDSIFLCSWYMAVLAKRGVTVSYLVSPSADGELAVRLLKVMGWKAVRGSATRSGVKAMHGMFRSIQRDGASPMIVPDGPRGPRREAKLGAVLLSRLSGVPVMPISGVAERVWELKTWDRLQIPVPFTKVVLTMGKPLMIASDADEEATEEARIEIDRQLGD